MNAIVCDTSSLSRLFKGHSVQLLSQLFEKVFVPCAVFDECSPQLREALQNSAFEICEPSTEVISSYGLGERAVLNYAIEHRIELILTDDVKATKAAARHHLIALGSLDVLVLAKRKGLLVSIVPVIQQIQQTGEHLELLDILEALDDAHEAPIEPKAILPKI